MCWLYVMRTIASWAFLPGYPTKCCRLFSNSDISVRYTHHVVFRGITASESNYYVFALGRKDEVKIALTNEGYDTASGYGGQHPRGARRHEQETALCHASSR